jgi:hypothetical protein
VRINVPAPIDLLGGLTDGRPVAGPGLTGGTRILVPPFGLPGGTDWPGGLDAGVGVGEGAMGGTTDDRLPAPPPDVAAARLG